MPTLLSEDRGAVLAAAAVALAGTAVLAPALGERGMGRDEGATLYAARLPLGELADMARVQDVVLVPYYLLQHVWLLAGDGLVWARVPSLLAYAAAVFLASRAAAVWGAGRWALLAGLVTATSPRLVEEVFNARPYALSAAAASVSLLGLARLDQDRPRGALLFAGGATAAVALHQFAGLGPLTGLLLLAVLRRWPWRRALAVGAVPAALLLLIGLASVPQRGQVSWLADLDVRLAAELVLGAFGQRPVGGLPQALLAAGLVALLLAQRRRLPVRVAVTGAFLVVPACVLVVVSLATPVHGERYVTASVPALGVLAALTARELAGSRLRRGAVVVAAALVAVSAATATVDRSRLAERGEGFAELSALCGRGDLVAIPTHMAAGGLAEYLGDHVRLWPVRDQPYLERFRLDSRPEVIARAPAHVTVCDVHSSYDAEDVARFESELRAAGYRLERAEQASEVFVRSYRRA